MKWVKKEPNKDGAYFTYVLDSDSLGSLMRINGKWYAKISQGIIPIPSVEGIDYFCKVVRPKDANSKVR